MNGGRLSDEDREDAVDRLQRAYADGWFGPAELERRLELALTATRGGELEPALADLPDEADEVTEIVSTAGNIVRTGDWQVPRLLRVDSEYGKVRLDMSRAALGSQTDIELCLTYGSAVILLPSLATANADGTRTRWGTVTCTAPGRTRQGRPHVRVTGELTYGNLVIRHPRAWRWNAR
ncbi:DUF1707 domain-containing protein [Spongiactinospora sp. TRM90649]|uniref:DUF1707 SHOCT-like domain-containing protein n=1 Tax=Spongiactinospora sp. TRM90649 TaxID=3031114 RepID=UPI0023F7B1A5|nr:DUF1707 domain-containing protein [Spongiactinospora sp. TRM90649]MDF5756249.1 DUF1707 domain-containing protein [Spongiactinospora sp. TRM90649]